MQITALSESERMIMECFWEKDAMKTTELFPMLAKRRWKPTTVLTFLSRLAAKGMLAVERTGKSNVYRPLCSRREYQQYESRVFLNERYGGNATGFFAALVESGSLSKSELEELREWLDRQVSGHE